MTVAPAPDPTRRALLRGGRRTVTPVRPPWAHPELFTDLCSRCGACASACPQRIIVRGDGGFPEVRFAQGECTFCAACVAACDSGAFLPDGAAWSIGIAVGAACLATRGIYCRSCQDACPSDALKLRPLPGGRAAAEIDATSCTGCGACVSACPAGAITASPAAGGAHG